MLRRRRSTYGQKNHLHLHTFRKESHLEIVGKLQEGCTKYHNPDFVNA